MRSRHSVDLTKGSVLKNLLLFTLPLLATNILQQLYNAADVIVVGKFAGKIALAAVGSTGAITTLLLNIFNGLAIGTNVVCANLYGARKKEALERSMYTSLLIAFFGGLLIAAVGIFFARPLLSMMNCPDNVIGQATKYMQIYFGGIPASLIYNFGAGILRAHGDTKRPMYILSITGIVNVALNLVFVVGMHWDVAGVATATAISQILSAVAVLWLLFHPEGEFGMRFSKFRFHKQEFKKILSIGIPCGLNGMVFSVANVILQSTANTFGDITVAGISAAGNIVNFVYMIIASFYSACVSFSGQNYGAKQYRRIDQLLLWSIVSSAFMVILTAVACTLFHDQLLFLYTDDPAVMAAGTPNLLIMCWSYVIYTIPETAIGCLRGIGKSTGPTLLNAFCICIPRILWIYLVFPLAPSTTLLYSCFPVSYIICAVGQMIYFLRCRKALFETLETVQGA